MIKLKHPTYWDSTKQSEQYPQYIKKTFYQISLNNRKFFSKWIGKIGKKFSKDIDWWATLPASRNPLVSDLFRNICILETLKILSKRKKKIIIKVDSLIIADLISEWSKKEGTFIEVDCNEKKLIFKDFFKFLKSVFFHIFIFLWINLFVKRKFFPQNKDTVLIHTFASKTSQYDERLFFGLRDFFKKNKIKNVYFVPSLISAKNLFKIVKVINIRNKENYIFKEHYINIKDIVYAIFHFWRSKKFITKYTLYKNWDLTNLVCGEINSLKDYSSKIMLILNYKFSENLSRRKIKLKKTISWHETQVDKGWNFGFRKHFPSIKTYGYQGFPNLPQLMHTIPTSAENSAKVLASEIITIGKLYLKPRKEFFPKLKISVGPALIYQDIFKNYKKSYKIKILVILSGIKSQNITILNWISEISRTNSNFKIFIKPHKELPLKNASFELNENLKITNEPLSSLLKKTKIA